MLGIILGIVTFILLVLFHEFGHFIAAKKSGVQVKEFGLGMPPRALTLRTDKSGTKYTLNWIPLGGFCSLKGEDGVDESHNKDSDSFVSAKLWKKLIIIAGGVIMNFIVAWIIFSVLFMIGIKPMTIVPDDVQGLYSESYLMPSMSFIKSEGFLSGTLQDGPLVIDQVLSGSLAETLGLQSGGIILSINDVTISTLNLNSQLLKLKNTKNNRLVYLSDSENSSLQVLNFSCDEECKLGLVYHYQNSFELLPVKFEIIDSMIAGLKEIKAEWNLTMSALGTIGKKLFSFNMSETKDALKQLTGPVGAVKFGEKLFEEFGFLIFLGFGGMISVALAIFNILPIPALDGGRFLALILQKIFCIKDEKFSMVEGFINMIIFWILMLFGVIIILKDLIVFWGVNIPFIG